MAYKARSITSKASSACKINMGLVSGEADVQNSKAFVNYGEIVEKKMAGGGGGTSSEEAKADKSEDKSQSDGAVDVPETTDTPTPPATPTV
tara:strand:+ start:330 stop:602 length:273 start_codon:yes stop_codon:yes gene_type:complete